MINKLFNTFFLNALLSIILAFVLIIQEVHINEPTFFTLLLFGLEGSVAGTLFGEILNVIITKKALDFKNMLYGLAVGLVSSIIIALTV